MLNIIFTHSFFIDKHRNAVKMGYVFKRYAMINFALEEVDNVSTLFSFAY